MYTSFIDENFKDVATIREYGSSAEAILDLLAGRIDVAFDDVTFFNSVMDKPENKPLVFTGRSSKVRSGVMAKRWASVRKTRSSKPSSTPPQGSHG
ncbi:hypothetical protein QNM99_10685 [Pseudomonas sp. PCH446]